MGAFNPFHAAARQAHANGLSVIPVKMDGSKEPSVTWALYQTEQPSVSQIDQWYGDGLQTGLYVVMGKGSGNAEMIEAETAEVFDAYVSLGHETGLGELIERVTSGYLSASPGGGRHMIYRCSEIEGNLKLARRPKLPDEMRHENDKIQVLFETRGQGGGAIEPPSNGKVHPSGGRYTQVRGGFSTIVTISPDERHDLLNLARTFDQMPADPPREPRGRTVKTSGRTVKTDLRPGDDFNARTDLLELMLDHGWGYAFTRNNVHFIRRPGKDRGVSATINHAGSGFLYVFTSSTEFEPNTSYSAFGAYAVLEHAGDFSAAAKALREDGFGPHLEVIQGGASSPPPPPPGDDPADDVPPPRERPKIDATDQYLERISARVWDGIVAANVPERLFRYGGLPSRVVRAEDGSPSAQVLNEDRLSHEAARAVLFYKDTEREGRKHASPPMRVIRDMLAAPECPLPPLLGITEAPTFAPDGSIAVDPGYHAASRLFYAPAPGFVVPPVADRPSQEQLDQARDLLVDELLADFPFTGDAERAHTLAMLILPFVRGLIPGPTPLHLIEKPTAGTGATLLADVAMRLATGRPIGAMNEGRDEDEWRKRLTSKLRGGPPIVLIDNLRRRLDSGVVSAALTAHHIEDRILGTSDNIRIPVRCVWIASGNNPALSSEITRRTVRIRLDAKRDKPWLRREFKHYPLLPWVIEERPQLVAACLTLGQAWIDAGRPTRPDAPILGSFEEWSAIMGGILDIAGVPGFLTNLDEFYDASDTEGADIRAFLLSWWEKHAGTAVGVADLFAIATADESALDLGDKGERSQKIRLGKMLADLRDRHYQLRDRLTVRVSAAGTEKRAQLWRLVALSSTDGECDEYGECSASARGRESTGDDEYIYTDTGEKHSQPSPHSPEAEMLATDDFGTAGYDRHTES